MVQVTERLYVGTDRDCRPGGANWAVVHACKSPCHQRAVGYRGSLPKSHEHYLVLEEEHDLYLNLVDPPTPLFMPPSFSSFLGFACSRLERGANLLIHCNQGESRAPSLALLLLAKRLGVLPSLAYESAWQAFQELYSGYRPGLGIQAYLREHWEEL